jgi:hypothetical protein
MAVVTRFSGMGKLVSKLADAPETGSVPYRRGSSWLRVLPAWPLKFQTCKLNKLNNGLSI